MSVPGGIPGIPIPPPLLYTHPSILVPHPFGLLVPSVIPLLYPLLWYTCLIIPSPPPGIPTPPVYSRRDTHPRMDLGPGIPTPTYVQTKTVLWKHYLPSTSLAGVKYSVSVRDGPGELISVPLPSLSYRQRRPLLGAQNQKCHSPGILISNWYY